ncbi:MAG: hypothetical protein ACLP01_32200 [Solirubrobacteraceae bacterium]
MAELSPIAFRRSRRVVEAGLVVAAGLLVAFWVLWWSDRGLLASRTTPAYFSFENDFPLADGWLLGTIVAATVQLWRRRPSALLWLIAAAGAGLYLLGMDMLYDLEHQIYASNSAGVIELLIDILTAGASIGALWWSWRYRQLLLNPTCGQV